VRAIIAVGLCLLLCSAAVGGEQPPSFARKPTARKRQGVVRVEFAVDRATDVAVFIEGPGGSVVRHLAAGVLGENPPEPFKPGLSQSLEWDGRADYGRPPGDGPFRVRVALGLRAGYGGIPAGNRLCVSSVYGMAVGSDGTLYVTTSFGAGVPNWPSVQLVAVNRDGTYQRTVIPPPAGFDPGSLEALGGRAVTVRGRAAPVFMSIANRAVTAFRISGRGGTAVTPDGALLVCDDSSIGTVAAGEGADRSRRWACPGPLPANAKASFDNRTSSHLAVSADGKWVYFTGLARERSRNAKSMVPPYPAVFRARLPERSPAEVFFGDLEQAGTGKGRLAAGPRGLAFDGQGHLLVADRGNNRVVAVVEKSGDFAGEFAVGNPLYVVAGGKDGAVYVLRSAGGRSNSVVLAKHAGWRDPKVVAELPLNAYRPAGAAWVMAGDLAAKPPVLWLTDRRRLLRVEDLGGKFGEPRRVDTEEIGNGAFVDVTVDRWRPDPEVYARCGQGQWRRFNEKSGKLDWLKLSLHGAAGTCIEVGPDGVVYALGWPKFLYKWSRDGKELKWETPFRPPDGKKDNRAKGNSIYVPVCMVYMTHTLGIRGDGHLFVFEKGKGSRPPKALYEYLPSGKRASDVPIIWKVSDSAVGPKFDPDGNIYVLEQLKPVDELVPPEFAEFVGAIKIGSKFNKSDPRGNPPQMYGSVVKFSRRGGMIDWPGAGYNHVKNNPFDGAPKLAAGLKTVEAAACYGNTERFVARATVTGAEWFRGGVSHVELFYCNCESTVFDVDEFGRVWYPDLCRFRVGVLDTNGNQITTFGAYGNADNRGPDSVDEKLADPPLAFAWLAGVGVTDKYAYMGDSMNRRLLRAEITYAAEETCPVE
jgi:hypothetical protein